MPGPSPLVGYNTNVRHKGKLYHIQTEDSGVNHPHVITHLFADGGRIIASRKTAYAEHLGASDLATIVKRLMQEQHKAMFIELRDCVYDDQPSVPLVVAPEKPAPATPPPAPPPPPPAQAKPAPAVAAPASPSSVGGVGGAQAAVPPPPPPPAGAQAAAVPPPIPAAALLPPLPPLPAGALQAPPAAGASSVSTAAAVTAAIAGAPAAAGSAVRPAVPAAAASARTAVPVPAPKFVGTPPPMAVPSRVQLQLDADALDRAAEARLQGSAMGRLQAARRGAGRYQQTMSARPARPSRAPSARTSFGGEALRGKSLDEVILSYLSDDAGEGER